MVDILGRVVEKGDIIYSGIKTNRDWNQGVGVITHFTKQGYNLRFLTKEEQIALINHLKGDPDSKRLYYNGTAGVRFTPCILLAKKAIFN